MIISNESMNFKDPKESDDPQQFDDQLEVWTLIIVKSTTSFPSEEVPLLRSPLHIDLHKQNEEATRLQYWRDLGAVEEQRREEIRTGGSRNCFPHDCNFCVLQGKSKSGGNLVSTFTFSFFVFLFL